VRYKNFPVYVQPVWSLYIFGKKLFEVRKTNTAIFKKFNSNIPKSGYRTPDLFAASVTMGQLLSVKSILSEQTSLLEGTKNSGKCYFCNFSHPVQKLGIPCAWQP